jgi:hypothetical protein
LVGRNYYNFLRTRHISRLSLDSKLVKSVSDLKKIGEYSGFQRYVCKNDNGGWVQFYLSSSSTIRPISSSENDGTSTEVVVGFKIFPTIGIL